jgi:hypothetical protein
LAPAVPPIYNKGKAELPAHITQKRYKREKQSRLYLGMLQAKAKLMNPVAAAWFWHPGVEKPTGVIASWVDGEHTASE